MNTSYSLQNNSSDLISNARKRRYGVTATAKDYKDNFILGNEILDFPLNRVEDLLLYKETDSKAIKVAKSVTLKSNAHDRLVKISELLGLSESETCRLIIYYLAENHEDNGNVMPTEIEEEIALLKKALNEANRALEAIEEHYRKSV